MLCNPWARYFVDWRNSMAPGVLQLRISTPNFDLCVLGLYENNLSLESNHMSVISIWCSYHC